MPIPFIKDGNEPQVRPLRKVKERVASRPSWMLSAEPATDPNVVEFDPELLHQMQNSLRLLAEASQPTPKDPNEIVDLAFMVARSVLHEELQSHPEALKQRVEVALEHLGTAQSKRVRLHPALAKELGDPPEGVSFIIDDAMQPGAILVESAERSLDVSWDNQLERFESELRRSLEEERAA